MNSSIRNNPVSNGLKSTVFDVLFRSSRDVEVAPPPPPPQDQAAFKAVATAPVPPEVQGVVCAQFEQYRMLPLTAAPRLAKVEVSRCAFSCVQVLADAQSYLFCPAAASVAKYSSPGVQVDGS